MSEFWQWLLAGIVLLWAWGYLSWWMYRGLYPGGRGSSASGCGGCGGCGAGKVPVALVPLKRNGDT
jgi:hypothetical protein